MTSGPLTRVGVAVGATVGLFVGVGVDVSVGRSVGVGLSVGDGFTVGDSATVGVSEGIGERVGEGVYVGNKPIERIDVSIIAKAKHPQQHRAIARGITGQASLLPATEGRKRLNIPPPSLRWTPDLVVGMPVLRANLYFAREIPSARFQEKDRPGIPVLVLLGILISGSS